MLAHANITNHCKNPMTHSPKNQKMKENEVESIENAVKDAGIRAIHPEKMEAFADVLVNRLKEPNYKGAGKHWRTGGPLED